MCSRELAFDSLHTFLSHLGGLVRKTLADVCLTCSISSKTAAADAGAASASAAAVLEEIERVCLRVSASIKAENALPKDGFHWPSVFYCEQSQSRVELMRELECNGEV